MNTFVAGLVLGVAGSGHCVAMCGPLVAAIAPVGRHAAWYHSGRAGTYVVLGLVAGLVGATFTGVGLGRSLAFLMAAVIALQAAARWWGSPWNATSSVTRRWRELSGAVHTFASTHPLTGAVGLGAMNGMLPCGLVYAAAAAATGLGGVTAAVFFMFGFAIGTTPLLATSALSIRVLSRIPAFSRVAPVVLLLLAVLLVVRGLQVPSYGAHVH